MDKFRKIIKGSGILANVKTTSEGAGLMSVLFIEVVEMLLLAEQEEHLEYKKSVRTDSDLKMRGVEDILLTVSDNLPGFTRAIQAVFPGSNRQICVVHQLRNSLRRVSYKDKKSVVDMMKPIYNAPNEKEALKNLWKLKEKWGKKYPYIISSWERNWEHLTTFLEYPLEIRKIIYTNNAIENLNGKIRKLTHHKMSFPNNDALMG